MSLSVDKESPTQRDDLTSYSPPAPSLQPSPPTPLTDLSSVQSSIGNSALAATVTDGSHQPPFDASQLQSAYGNAAVARESNAKDARQTSSQATGSGDKGTSLLPVVATTDPPEGTSGLDAPTKTTDNAASAKVRQLNATHLSTETSGASGIIRQNATGRDKNPTVSDTDELSAISQTKATQATKSVGKPKGTASNVGQGVAIKTAENTQGPQGNGNASGLGNGLSGDKQALVAPSTVALDEPLKPAVGSAGGSGADSDTSGVQTVLWPTLAATGAAQTQITQPGQKASTTPVVDAGVGSPEYQVFLQQVQTIRENLLKSATSRKQRISDGATREKQKIGQFVEAEAIRLEGIYDDTVKAIRNGLANARTEIEANKNSKIESTRTAAQTELDRLNTIERDKKAAMERVGKEKAGAATTMGDREAQRAIDGSQTRADRAQQIKREKISQLRTVKDGESLTADVERRVADLVREFAKQGGDLAAMARKRAGEAAAHITDEASQISTKLSEPVAAARTEIAGCRDESIKSIEDEAQTSLVNLEKEADGIVIDLQNDKQTQCALVRANTEAISQAIDASVIQANLKVDSETDRIGEEITKFVAQITDVNWAGPELESAGSDLANAITQHNTEQDGFATNVVTDFGTGITNAVSSLADAVTEQGKAVSTIGSDFESEASKASAKVIEKMEDARKEGADKIADPTKQVEEKLQRGVDRAGEEWDRQIKDTENDISHDINDGLNKQDAAVAGLTSSLDRVGVEARSFVSSIVDAIVDFGSFIAGVVVGMIEHIWDLLKDIWELIKKPLFWIVVAILIVVAIVVIVFFGWSALVGALAFIGKALLIIGLIIGIGVAIYYIYLAITKPDLSPYERGKLVGKAIDEVILAFLGTGVLSKLASWVARVSRIAAFLDKVGDIIKAARLLRRARDIEVAIRLVDEIKDAGIALRLLDEIDDVEAVLKLWRAVGNAEDILKLWAEIKNAESIIKLWTEIKNADAILRLWAEIKDADQILKLWAAVKDADVILRLWAKVRDADLIVKLWGELADADKLIELLDLARDPNALFRLLGRIADRAILERLLRLAEDASQLEAMLILLGDDAPRLLRFMDLAGVVRGNGTGILLERMMQTAAVKAGDAGRVEMLCQIAAGDSARFARLAALSRSFRQLPTAGIIEPGEVLANGYLRANMPHFPDRHIMEFFAFTEQNLRNDATMWPEGTTLADITSHLAEALTDLARRGELPRIGGGNAQKVATAGGFQVQVGVRAVAGGTEIGQFFPINTGIQVLADELRAIGRILNPTVL
jgi:hypothetical protein